MHRRHRSRRARASRAASSAPHQDLCSQWSFVWAGTPSEQEARDLVGGASKDALILAHCPLSENPYLRGSPVPSPEEYTQHWKSHVLVVGRADSIERIVPLEEDENGLVARIYFKRAMKADDGTDFWCINILGGCVPEGLPESHSKTLTSSAARPAASTATAVPHLLRGLRPPGYTASSF